MIGCEGKWLSGLSKGYIHRGQKGGWRACNEEMKTHGPHGLQSMLIDAQSMPF